jgi:hypothetical protein
VLRDIQVCRLFRKGRKGVRSIRLIVEDHVAFESHVALARLGVQREEIVQGFVQLEAMALGFDHVLDLGSIL